MTDHELFEVAVEAPLHHTLTYRAPTELLPKLQMGSRVVVPLGTRKSKGVVISYAQKILNDKISKIKNISETTEDLPLNSKNVEWLKWLSQYYLHPLGLVYSMAFAPQATERKRKSKNISPTDFKIAFHEPETPPTANAEQSAAIKEIVRSAQAERFDTFLLYGITGSGKTEVYLQSIQEVLKSGKHVLVLVPEISLTPQLIRRFVSRFGENVAVIHSHLTEREKSDQWQAALSGKKKILVGARSALFCPLEDIGLIVVDEEHETSFKQEEQLKYNARDAAIMKAHIFKCPIVLGSATPSLETWQNCETGKYKKLELSARVENRPLPEVEVVDMRAPIHEKRDQFIPQWLSTKLYDEILLKLKNKEQVALFINRRGYAQFGLCSACGFTEQCAQCSVTLTLHKRGTVMVCHYCGFTKPTPPDCPSCHEEKLKPIGLGTEKIKEELQGIFPEAKIARADRDEINSRKDLEELLDKITKHEVDIIIGTQMIAKGHDFPELTLVGALSADLGLHFPDFRSSERTFQLLTQVAGRAGRHQKPGKVMIQTHLPEHPAIKFATTHDFAGFASQELNERKDLIYPPYGKMAMVRIQAGKEAVAEKMADQARVEIDALKGKNPAYQNIEVLGPAIAAMAKIKNKYRFQILLKTSSSKELNLFLQHFLKSAEVWNKSKSAQITVDVDPINLL